MLTHSYARLSPARKRAVLVLGVVLVTLAVEHLVLPPAPAPPAHVSAGPHVRPQGLLPFDGLDGTFHELFIAPGEAADYRARANSAPAITLSEEDVQWLDVLTLGWAAPLRGFMREAELLQTLHFNSIEGRPGTNERISMPIPIVLAISDAVRTAIGSAQLLALRRESDGTLLGVLERPEIYEHRKAERIAREFGTCDESHPYVERILAGGPWLVGGDVAVFSKITYGDGLDALRLSPREIRAELTRRGADACVAFQTRNPIHAAHAFLMTESLRQARELGFKRPVLWLSPLGGWTKDDDVPLAVRVAQHQAALSEGMVPAADTLLAIWPSPMVYAGPTEVQWHAKSRRNGGAGFFITGRDPAGLKRKGTDEDLYKESDGRTVLTTSPGLSGMRILTFAKVAYDTKTSRFAYFDETRPDDFISISGSKMRALAREGKEPPAKNFMGPKAWAIVVNYYQSLPK